MGDWIKLHRLIVSWEWFTTPNMLVFWVYCLTRASYKDSRYKGIELQAGQFIDGRKAMALHTGLTESQVRTCLERLKSTNEIASQSTNEYTIFTINSWKKYQIDEGDHQPISQPIANESPANRHIQEVKKVKKEKNNTNTVVSVPETLAIIPGFLIAWEKWLEHLRQKRKPPTALAMAGQLKRLQTMKNPIGSIEYSIEHNWQGIFEDKTEQKPKTRMEQLKEIDEQVKRNLGTLGYNQAESAQVLCDPSQVARFLDFGLGD